MMTTDPNLRSCQRCGKSFEPRSGSGGSVQRFCCTGCRLSFHKQRLRSERRGAHAGSIAPSGTQQPPQNETPTSEPTITALRPCETGLDARTVNAISVAAPSYDPIQSCITILHHSGCDTARQRTPPGAAYSAPKSLPATVESLLRTKCSQASAPAQRGPPGKQGPSTSPIVNAPSSSWP